MGQGGKREKGGREKSRQAGQEGDRSMYVLKLVHVLVAMPLLYCATTSSSRMLYMVFQTEALADQLQDDLQAGRKLDTDMHALPCGPVCQVNKRTGGSLPAAFPQL